MSGQLARAARMMLVPGVLVVALPGRTTAAEATADSEQRSSRPLTRQSSVYNLFDQHYAVPAGDELTPDVIQQDGRTFRVKLVYRF